MDKRLLSERDICTKFIMPALDKAGWDLMSQVREEVYFTKGRIIVRGKLVSRGKAKKADFVLYIKPNIPVALIEAKDNNHAVGDGMQQGLEYAEALGVPFVFSSNGDGFSLHDRTGATTPVEINLGLDAFPSPADLWARYRLWKGLPPEAEQIVLQDFFDDGSGKAPRYYQVAAVNAAIQAIAKGQNRILLVMATGTGKTYTAFQIIWRLWKSGRKKRILFLADRNVLIDQTMVNDFRPFGPAMAKLSTSAKTIERPDGSTVDLPLALDKKRRIDTAFEIYLGLYQAITGPEERDKIFREFSPGFFDLIVIDECHRGSAAADSAWREILDHFSSATQIGLTATPKETEYVSNIHYFGEPVYSYTLKQGISDGFLAPYKVIKVHIDRDIEGYRPEKGQVDREGEEVEDRIYNAKDFDRNLVLDDRTKLVAAKVTEFLKESGDRFQKTIVFCVDEEHAARTRQALINENADLCAENSRYVMRITGSDKEGQDQLGNFIDPESKYPVIVTTSRLLSTGVDAQTCRLIVLDRAVGSMTEFKQIVGRGTRVHEDSKKFYFTLIDFRGATSHFADPDFDGEPVQIYQPGENDPITPPDDAPSTTDAPSQPGPEETIVDDPASVTFADKKSKQKKVYVDGVGVTILAERVEYLDENGKLVTESLRDFTKAALKKRFASLEVFLKRWKSVERKQTIIDELAEEGLSLDPLADEVGKNLDPFDLICHVAFDQKPLTRRERAENVKKRDVFTKYGPQARAVLDALLAKYSDEGVLSLPDEFGEANVSQHVAIIRSALPGSEDFLHRLVLSPYFQAFIFDEQTGAGRGGLPKNRMDRIAVALPPLAEQHRIVAKVEELMALCDRLETARAEREATRGRLAAASLVRLNAPDPDPSLFAEHARFALDNLPALATRPDQIKQIRQTILNLAVRGKLVPQDAKDEPAAKLLKRIEADKKELLKAGKLKKVEPVADLSKSRSDLLPAQGWAITNLHSVCNSITDGDHLPPPKAEQGIPFLVIGNVRSQRIEFEGSRFVSLEYYQALDPIRQPTCGDLLYTLVGSYGIPVLVRDDRPFCVQRHIGILRPSKRVDVRFLAVAMESRFAFDQATACATGIAQKTVPLSGLRKLVVPLPPLAEQHRIVKKVDALMALCDQLEASLTATETTRRRLLEALLAAALEPAGARELEPVE